MAYWELDNESGQVVTDKTGQYDGVLGSTMEIEVEDPSWSEDGCVEKTTNVEERLDEISIQISPNPTSGLLSIQHRSSKELKLRVTNVTGELIMTKQVNQSNFSLDISEYPSGFYFIQMQLGNQLVSRKLIKK